MSFSKSDLDDKESDVSEESFDSDGSGGDSSEDVFGDDVQKLPPSRLAMVVMTCMIMGYTLIGPLQHELKVKLNIQSDTAEDETFQQVVALTQWGKTIMTLLQNVVLASVTTKNRVYLSMGFMLVGVLIPPLFIFTLGRHSMILVAISYSLVGISLGIFESAFLSVISPLGPLTKAWAIMGFPLAFGIVNIIGFGLMASLQVPVVCLFWLIAAAVPVAVFAFRAIVPAQDKRRPGHMDDADFEQAGVQASLSQWRSWLVPVIPFLLVFFFTKFVMESILPAMFNTYSGDQVYMYGPKNTKDLMSKKWFLVILSFCTMAGDMISRRVVYFFKLRRKRANITVLLFALGCSAFGLYIGVTGIAMWAFISVFLSFWAVGLVYAVTSKYIDKFVPKTYNMAAYSLWIFIGNCGGIAGAVLTTWVKRWMCHAGHFEFQCVVS